VLKDRWTFSDPVLGDSIAFGGSRPIILISCGLGAGRVLGGAVVTVLGSRSNSLANLTAFVLIASFSWGLALNLWRARFVVGVRGFRFDKPWRPWQNSVELLWDEVSASDVGMAAGPGSMSFGRRERTWLVVTRSDGVEVTFGRGFSASWWEIQELMEKRRNASLATATG
jgi:hypothetical protein